MEDLSSLTRPSTLMAMHKAHALLSEVCYRVGDLNFDEYTFLLGASRNEQGTSSKKLADDFSFYLGDSTFLSKSVAQKELADFVRNLSDRRGYAVRITRKGITRLALVDEAMVLSLMNAGETITQSSIEYLIDYCRYTVFPSDQASYVETIIPYEFVLIVCRYRAALIRSCACVGLSSLHAVILLLIDASSKAASVVELSHWLRIPEVLLFSQLEFLEERRLLEETGAGTFELGEEGITRIDSFVKKSNDYILEFMKAYTEGERSRLEELCRYCDYLFQ